MLLFQDSVSILICVRNEGESRSRYHPELEVSSLEASTFCPSGRDGHVGQAQPVLSCVSGEQGPGPQNPKLGLPLASPKH